MKRFLYIFALCGLFSACSENEIFEETQVERKELEVPQLVTRSGNALTITTCDFVGFSSNNSYQGFGKALYANNAWAWESSSTISTTATKLLAALPAGTWNFLDLQTGSTDAFSLTQAGIATLTNGLMLGSNDIAATGGTTIDVFHQLAQITLKWEETRTMPATVTFKLAGSATVNLDGTDGKMLTVNEEASEYTYTLTADDKKNRTIVLPIFPQTFSADETFLSYSLTKNDVMTDYSFALKAEKVLARNCALEVTLGDEGTVAETVSGIMELIKKGGEVSVDEPVAHINLNGITIAKNVVIKVNKKVDKITLYGNNASDTDETAPNVTFEFAADVPYPTFSHPGGNLVRNVTIRGINTSLNTCGSLEFGNGKNITLDGIHFAPDAHITAYTYGVDGLTIQNCKVENHNASSWVSITNNSIPGGGVNKNGKVTIHNNLVSYANHSNVAANPSCDVLYLCGVLGNLTISNNTFTGSVNHHTVYIADASGAIAVTNNNISNVVEDGIKIDRSENITITGNTITGANCNGIRLDHFDADATAVITGNTISANTKENDEYGINLKSTDNGGGKIALTVKDNKIGQEGIKNERYFYLDSTLQPTAESNYTYPYIIVENNCYITTDNAIGLLNAEALKWLATEVNDNNNKFTGKRLKLLANIDLRNAVWTPICKTADAHGFQGTFDGNDKTIFNLNIVKVNEDRAAGLFGGMNGTVKNLTINGATVNNISIGTLNANNSGYVTDNGTAVVAGSVYSWGVISNVKVIDATVNGNRYVGGIGGYVYGIIENCTVSGNTTITATPDELLGEGSYDNGDKAGGIAGFVGEASEENKEEKACRITGNIVTGATIHAYRDFGGIAGRIGSYSVVTGNTVTNVTLEQDYTLLTTERTTMGDIYGRSDGGNTVTDENNSATGVKKETITKTE